MVRKHESLTLIGPNACTPPSFFIFVHELALETYLAFDKAVRGVTELCMSSNGQEKPVRPKISLPSFREVLLLAPFLPK